MVKIHFFRIKITLYFSTSGVQNQKLKIPLYFFFGIFNSENTLGVYFLAFFPKNTLSALKIPGLKPIYI